MTNPFDYVNSIILGKNNMMRDTENDTLAEKVYKPWVVNKALSYFVDTILVANDMNIYHGLDKRPQYEYFINVIRRNKRWAKWVKDVESDDLDLVVKAYNCNPTVGREYLKLLTKSQLDHIRSTMVQGGTPK